MVLNVDDPLVISIKRGGTQRLGTTSGHIEAKEGIAKSRFFLDAVVEGEALQLTVILTDAHVRIMPMAWLAAATKICGYIDGVFRAIERDGNELPIATFDQLPYLTCNIDLVIPPGASRPWDSIVNGVACMIAQEPGSAVQVRAALYRIVTEVFPLDAVYCDIPDRIVFEEVGSSVVAPQQLQGSSRSSPRSSGTTTGPS